VYPCDLEVREYQFNVTATALFHNTLVCLPTGLGKTLVAAVVMYNFYRWFPRVRASGWAVCVCLCGCEEQRQGPRCNKMTMVRRNTQGGASACMPHDQGRAGAGWRCRHLYAYPVP
jgi:hypothetical protein